MTDISFLKNRVRETVLSDVVAVAKYHANKETAGGWFGVPRQVFCFVDFLGAVSYNNDPSRREDGASTRKTVRFINEFFPRDYKPYSNLMVAYVASWYRSQLHAVHLLCNNGNQEGDRKVVIKHK